MGGKRPVKSFTISVLEGRGLVSSKGEGAPLSSCVSFTLLDNEPAESEVVAESTEPAYALAAPVELPTDDATLGRLVAAPLAISVFEVAGADKVLRGVVSLSLEPLLEKASLEQVWLPLQPGPDGAEAAGELLVSVEGATPLLSEDDLEESAVLTLRIAAMHKLPERWLLTEGQTEEDHIFAYKAGCSLRVGAGFPDTPLADGLIAPAAAPPAAADADADAEAAEGEAAEAPAPAEETPTGAPAAPEGANTEESAAQSIAWVSTTVRTFVGPDAMAALRDAADKGVSPLLVTVARGVKNAEAHVDPNAAKYRGVASVPLDALMAVDETVAWVRAPLGLNPEAEPEPEAEAEAAPAKGGKDKGKKGKGPEELPVEEEDEVHPFEAAGTYLRVHVSTSRPLNPRPPTPPPPLPKPSEIIPRRQLPQLAPKSAAAEFEAQVAALVAAMVGEWRALFPDFDPEALYGSDDKEERRRALLFQLNSSGQYYIFKEKLKRAVVRVVKETMHRPSAAPADAAQMDLFYNELYVTLTQRVHAALNAHFFPAAAPPAAPTAPDLPPELDGASPGAVLKALADEMESDFRFADAARLHQERVVSARDELASWYDYGVFLMRTGDAPKAEECTREAVALQGSDAEALTAHGCVLASRGDYEGAEVFFKGALDLNTARVESWLTMAVLYDLMGRTRDSKTATKQAVALSDGAGLGGAYLALAEALLPLNAKPLIERCLALEVSKGGTDEGSPALLLCRGALLLQCADFEGAAAALHAALDASPNSAAGCALLGHALLRAGDADGARAAYEKALKLAATPPVQVLLCLGRVCLGGGDYARAKAVFLQACRLAPSCTAWLGAGAASLRLKHKAEAEECLSEANVLNNREPAVWGQLALLCVAQERLAEAEQALHHALKLELGDAPLLIEVGSLFASLSSWGAAETCARRAIVLGAADASPAAHKLLADVLVEQRRFDEAAAAYTDGLGAAEGAGDAALAAELKALLRKVYADYLGKPQEANMYSL